MYTITPEQMRKNSQAYDLAKRLTYKQRLALHLGAKQNQRKAIVWPVVAVS